MACPGAKLMECGPVVIDLRPEGGLRRDSDIILGRTIKCAIAANAEVRGTCRDQRLGNRDLLALGKRRWRLRHPLGQAVALRHVEDGEALEERDLLGLVARCERALLFGLRSEAVGED